ncbi:VWA domain-containing protein [Saccharospirillum sp. HFRX-1]|uniref:VWA domain-containing protein n=1 Tax=unclassified Saccharospirillum TaxID=2633430 RepID=UPI0037241D53
MMLLRPWLLLLLLPWMLTWWWSRRRRRSGSWSRLIQPELLRALDHQPGRDPVGHQWMLGLAGVLIIVALAGPARTQPTTTGLSYGNLVVILDNSLSMAAEDLTPSRLERARRTVLDWADSGLFERTAVIIYSASAHWLMPLTEDAQTLALQLEQLDPFQMPRYGNRPDLAFQLLGEKQSQLAGQPLHRLWLTDDPGGDLLAEVDSSNPAGGSTWIMPVGTEQGGPIPLPNGDGFVTDGDRLVVASLDRDAFQRAARRLDGQLLALGSEPPEQWLTARRSVGLAGSSLQDIGPWLLLPALVLLLPWYRRGLVFALPFLVAQLLLWQPIPVAAEALLQNSEQQAFQAWRHGELERSRDLTERPELQAQLAFEAGDYATAARYWSQLDSADAHYNRGNALVYQGELEAALAAYDQALAKSDHPAAQYNRQLVADFLAQNRPPEEDHAQQEEAQPTQSLGLDQSETDAQSAQGDATADPILDAQQRVQNARLEQLLNRVPPPRGNLLERRLQQEYRQAPSDDPGATLW